MNQLAAWGYCYYLLSWMWWQSVWWVYEVSFVSHLTSCKHWGIKTHVRLQRVGAALVYLHDQCSSICHPSNCCLMKSTPVCNRVATVHLPSAFITQCYTVLYVRRIYPRSQSRVWGPQADLEECFKGVLTKMKMRKIKRKSDLNFHTPYFLRWKKYCSSLLQ